MSESRPPFPPFTEESALQKVRAAEDARNTRDPQRVALAYTPDSVWRNRDVFVTGREEIVRFLTAKWERELDYALRKSLWGSAGTASRSGSSTSATTRPANGGAATATSPGKFNDQGLMERREASINDARIDEGDRRIFGARSEAERGVDIPLQ